jgi:SulP family sulfate permease
MITAGSTLIIGIQEGILIGIGASMLFMLFRLSRPEVAELGHIPGTQIYQNLERKQQAKRFEEVIILRVDASFSFVNADYFKKFILEQSHKQRRDIHFVVIDGSSINDLDTTAIDSVATIVDTLRGWDIELYFTGLKGPVRDVVKRSGLRDKIGRNHFYQTSHDAIKEILGELDVRDDGKRSEDYKRRVDEG